MWLYVPSTCSASAPESAASTSASDSSLVEGFVQSVTWRGASIPRKSWPHVWKMVFSSQLLSGLTSKPSTLAAGVQSWLEVFWWADTLASFGELVSSLVVVTDLLKTSKSETACLRTEVDGDRLRRSCNDRTPQFEKLRPREYQESSVPMTTPSTPVQASGQRQGTCKEDCGSRRSSLLQSETGTRNPGGGSLGATSRVVGGSRERTDRRVEPSSVPRTKKPKVSSLKSSWLAGNRGEKKTAQQPLSTSSIKSSIDSLDNLDATPTANAFRENFSDCQRKRPPPSSTDTCQEMGVDSQTAEEVEDTGKFPVLARISHSALPCSPSGPEVSSPLSNGMSLKATNGLKGVESDKEQGGSSLSQTVTDQAASTGSMGGSASGQISPAEDLRSSTLLLQKMNRMSQMGPLCTTASHFPPVELDKGQPTPSTFGLMFCECLPSLEPVSPFSRTSSRMSRGVCKKCLKIWPPAGSMRNGVCTALSKSELPTSGSGSLSSPSGQLWPTPTVKGNYNKAGKWAKSGDGLATAVQRVEGPGRLNSAFLDWLIGLPIDWTASERLEMQSYRQWLDAHLPSFPHAQELISELSSD